jgi:uncharacterized repeat protein (TIGR03803 family)
MNEKKFRRVMVLSTVLSSLLSAALPSSVVGQGLDVSTFCDEVDCTKTGPGTSQAGFSATVLTSFGNGPRYPYGSLVRGTDGNLYGVTRGGGSNSDAVYRMTPSGTLTVLHVFSDEGGVFPAGPLVQGSDGNFYGTTRVGGAPQLGTVYRITPSGQLTLLYTFSDDGGRSPEAPEAGLVRGSDDYFYGTTLFGGSAESPGPYGAVYRVSTLGVLTVLHAFVDSDGAARNDGSGPYSAPIQAHDGDFYGTTRFGGTLGNGIIYRISSSGAAYMVLHTFNGSDGAFPISNLIEGGDGSLYGTTLRGGASNYGTVYRITPSGQHALLHSFTESDGSLPTAALVQGDDGNFYGTTQFGGTHGFGTLFRLTPSGEHGVLYNFGGAEGGFPSGLLYVGSNEFLVTASALGPEEGGAILRLKQSTEPADPDNGGSGGGALTMPVLAVLTMLLFLAWARGKAAEHRSEKLHTPSAGPD